MAGIFTAPTIRPEAPPATPSITDASVQDAANEAAADARTRRGRASTVLTSPRAPREAEASRHATLGAS